MTVPVITVLPTAPARTDAPAVFNARADAFLGALYSPFSNQMNASIAAFNTDFTAVALNVIAAQLAETNAELAETNAEAQVVLAAGQVVLATDQVALAAGQVVLATDQVALATAQVVLATDQVGLATTQAGNSATSASQAANTYDQFDDRYLGAFSTDPTVNNDGDALVTGTQYFNSTNDVTRVYNGTAFQDSAAIAVSINLASQVTGILASANGGTGISAVGISGNVLKSDGTNWTSAPEQSDAGGTVTSVGIAGGVTGLTTSGGPITVSGDITLGGTLVSGSGGTGLSAAGTLGNVLTSDGTNWTSSPNPSEIPSQTGNSGKYLKTDGSSATWQPVASGRTDIVEVGSSGANYVVQNLYEVSPSNVTITGTWQIFEGSNVLEVVETTAIGAIADYYIATETLTSSQIFYKVGYIADAATITVGSGKILQGVGAAPAAGSSGSTAAQSYAAQFKYQF